MEIYYTSKHIFWDNRSNDQLESNVFDEYLNDWTQVSNIKSINWNDHYSANFYASDNFEATYFKIVKNNHSYYFFVEDIEFDGVNGRQYYLKMDFYNTYTKTLIEELKRRNPKVVFKRKHADRFTRDFTGMGFDPITQWYISNIPEELKNYSGSIPIETKPLDISTYIGDVTMINIKNNGRYPINFDDYVWQDNLGKNRYWYLKVKRPNDVYYKCSRENDNGDSFNPDIYKFNFSTTFYLPLKKSDGTNLENTFARASNWPGDYIIDLISSGVPPWGVSKYYTSVSNIYPKEMIQAIIGDYTEPFPIDNSYILTPIFNEYNIIDKNILQDFLRVVTSSRFTSSNTNYNIANWFMEPMLWMQPFTNVSINQQLEIPTSYYLNMFIKSTTDPSVFKLNLYALTGSTLNILVDNTETYLNRVPNSNFVLPVEEKHSFMGDVFSNYIVNNANSLDTGLQLAREQQRISDKYAMLQGGLGMLTGGLGTALGIAGSFIDPIKGFNALIGGASTFGSSLITMNQQIEMNEFNLKSKVATTQATLADVANQASPITDTYGSGLTSLANPSSIYVTYQGLSEDEQKVVFSNIYFFGYVVNAVLNFNSYNNRVIFNYFEIANGSELAMQYLNYPKRIIRDVGRQLESGLRLWQTPSFDFTMNANNKEWMWN